MHHAVRHDVFRLPLTGSMRHDRESKTVDCRVRPFYDGTDQLVFPSCIANGGEVEDT